MSVLISSDALRQSVTCPSQGSYGMRRNGITTFKTMAIPCTRTLAIRLRENSLLGDTNSNIVTVNCT